MKTRSLLMLVALALPAAAQLTKEQRIDDFRNLADLYARRYDAIEWKKSAVNFDLLNISPWLQRVADAKSDLDFYDLMVEYVADLQDAHDQFLLPSDFEAFLGFFVDLYDGKPLIDSITRSVLPADQYPFQIGDELVSVDDKPAADWIKTLTKYVTGANPRTVARLAAELITDRPQVVYPFAHQIGDSATVVVKRASGAVETYSIPWVKSGTAVTTLGASAGPLAAVAARVRPAVAGVPRYQQYLNRVRNFTRPGTVNVVGFDRLAPVFAFPAGFVQRLGRRASDSFYTGSFVADDGTRVGYLRIADFQFALLSDLDREIKYFDANTDVLVVDVMRNPGGDACLAEDILSRLTTSGFQGVMAERRVTQLDILNLDFAISDATDQGDDAAVAQFSVMKTEYQDAFQNRQGRANALPLCAAGATRTPAATTYSKPVLLLTDEMSASSADIFAAMSQDNHIATLFGFRTMGAGGSPESYDAGAYSEGLTYVTRSLVVRLQPVVTQDYPTAPYIENIGVRPDVAYDYMTADNLANRGADFVKNFTAAAVKLVKGK